MIPFVAVQRAKCTPRNATLAPGMPVPSSSSLVQLPKSPNSHFFRKFPSSPLSPVNAEASVLAAELRGRVGSLHVATRTSQARCAPPRQRRDSLRGQQPAWLRRRKERPKEAGSPSASAARRRAGRRDAIRSPAWCTKACRQAARRRPPQRPPERGSAHPKEKRARTKPRR